MMPIEIKTVKDLLEFGEKHPDSIIMLEGVAFFGIRLMLPEAVVYLALYEDCEDYEDSEYNRMRDLTKNLKPYLEHPVFFNRGSHLDSVMAEFSCFHINKRIEKVINFYGKQVNNA